MAGHRSMSATDQNETEASVRQIDKWQPKLAPQMPDTLQVQQDGFQGLFFFGTG
jgi:hypothetical protein